MAIYNRAGGIFLLFSCAASTAHAADERPDIFAKVVECRSKTDAADRLACYDASVAALDTAEKGKELVVMDRKQVREARRSLFGFPLPRFNFGGGKVGGEDDISEIDSVVASFSRTQTGWSFTLANDAGKWETSDPLTRDPLEKGIKVHIRQAAMGTYLGSIGYNRGVRFRRVG